MGLQVVSYGTNSMWCREMMAKYRDNMTVMQGVEALLSLDVEHAYMEFDDHQHRCRPYMMLIGRPRSLEGDFPFGVTTINYVTNEDMTPVVYRYDLTRSNLTELARKGLYESEFEVPPIIQGNQFVLPCTVSLAGMPADGPDAPPVLFASVERTSLRCTDVTSGYQIDEYFREVPLSKEEQEFEERREESVGFDMDSYVPDELYQELMNREDLKGLIEPGEPEAVRLAQDQPIRPVFTPKPVAPKRMPESERPSEHEPAPEQEEEGGFLL